VCVATRSCKRKHRVVQSYAAWRVRDCWRTCRCIACRKSTLAREWSWIVRRWPTEWAERVSRWSR
jgi:hypothetical protein